MAFFNFQRRPHNGRWIRRKVEEEVDVDTKMGEDVEAEESLRGHLGKSVEPS
jgi:hypothetical protein